MKNTLITIFALALIFGLFGCEEKIKPGTVQPKRQEVRGLKTQTIMPKSVDDYYEVTGTVRPKTSSIISARVMGTVTALYVKDGDRVRKGQVLLVIDDRDAVARKNQAEGAYEESLRALASAKKQKELADITYERFKKLYDERALSRQELDQIETQRSVAASEFERIEAMTKRAKAALQEAEAYLGFTRVVSPIDGSVADKKIDLGSMAAPGMPLMTIEGVSYQVEANLNENLSGKIKKGSIATIIIDSIGKSIPGKVVEINPAIDPMTRTFSVKIDVSDPDLRSGFYGKVRFPIGKKEVLSIPDTALVMRGQLSGVYSVGEDNIITFRIVRTGAKIDNEVEILSGIRPGERVITEGTSLAIDGGILKESSK